jgi:hypothetical protein
MAAVGTAGAGSNEIKRFRRWGILVREFQQFATLALPVPLHHDGQAVNDDIKKTADRESQKARGQQKKSWMLLKLIYNEHMA